MIKCGISAWYASTRTALFFEWNLLSPESTRISPHEGLHTGASMYFLNHNWFLETEGCKDTPAESNQFRTNQAAFLGSIWRSLWNETSDTLDPKLGQRQNKRICEFLSVGVKPRKFLPKSEAAGNFYSPLQHAVASPYGPLLPLCWGIKFVQEVRFHDSITIRK